MKDKKKNRELDIYVYYAGADKRTRFKIAGELMMRFEVVYDTIVRRFATQSFRPDEVRIVASIISRYAN